MRGKNTSAAQASANIQAEVWAALDISAASKMDIAATGDPLSILE
jgi:hypothetical protein